MVLKVFSSSSVSLYLRFSEPFKVLLWTGTYLLRTACKEVTPNEMQ
jgi:hypothetical protein